MIDISTGKHFTAPSNASLLTRRTFGKGIAAVLAAGCAPSILSASTGRARRGLGMRMGMMGGSGGGTEYQIMLPAGAFINPLISNFTLTNLEVSGCVKAPTTGANFFGFGGRKETYFAGDVYYFVLRYLSSGVQYFITISTSPTVNDSIYWQNSGAWFTFKVNQSGYWVNDVLQGSLSGTPTYTVDTSNLYPLIGAWKRYYPGAGWSGQSDSTAAWYCKWMKWYNNGTLVRDFTAGTNGSAWGLVDAVSGNFFGNSGTGTIAQSNV